MSFPDKEKRDKCWSSRDEYWKCLDKYSPDYNPQSGEPGPNECKQIRKLYESSCPNQWVKHFDRKRTYEKFKELMKKGYDPVEDQK
ncbi:cytochrome c oxidase assembly factor 6 homolog [Culicoides brevitarsis]|uniref:cytochrome c oxidase assembly factor 6 homolog n=1 Tax=Culicoides brevitarsis TaxID=469753 RepID=UPI00307B272D